MERKRKTRPGPEYILTDAQVEWAWQKRLEDYSLNQIAGALYVGTATLRRALQRAYGTATPLVKLRDGETLVYKEDWRNENR